MHSVGSLWGDREVVKDTICRVSMSKRVKRSQHLYKKWDKDIPLFTETWGQTIPGSKSSADPTAPRYSDDGHTNRQAIYMKVHRPDIKAYQSVELYIGITWSLYNYLKPFTKRKYRVQQTQTFSRWFKESVNKLSCKKTLNQLITELPA